MAQPPLSSYSKCMDEVLSVNEIFLSLQGEGTRAGLPCAFVRLAGCNLRCRWCDTQYAWAPGQNMPLSAVLRQVADLDCRRVEVTGGEPMAQAATPGLLSRLCNAGFETLLETNGSLDLSRVDARVVKIVDVKCPSSGHGDSFLPANLELLLDHDEVKFVLADRADFDYAAAFISRHASLAKCERIFSPVVGSLEPATLVKWILDAKLDVRLGMQLHKIIHVR